MSEEKEAQEITEMHQDIEGSPFEFLDYLSSWKSDKPRYIIHSDATESENKWRSTWRLSVGWTLENAITENKLNPQAQKIANEYLSWSKRNWTENLKNSEATGTQPETTQDEINITQKAIQNLLDASKNDPDFEKERLLFHLSYLRMGYEDTRLKKRSPETIRLRLMQWLVGINADFENGLNEGLLDKRSREVIADYLSWLKDTNVGTPSDPPITPEIIEKAKNTIDQVLLLSTGRR